MFRIPNSQVQGDQHQLPAGDRPPGTAGAACPAGLGAPAAGEAVRRRRAAAPVPGGAQLLPEEVVAGDGGGGGDHRDEGTAAEPGLPAPAAGGAGGGRRRELFPGGGHCRLLGVHQEIIPAAYYSISLLVNFHRLISGSTNIDVQFFCAFAKN
uniref:Uncharacterized protein n=1 Tax=Oryza glumipatula TaxID=40148 RepID=A0A0D9YNM6_9ORYZ